MLKNIYLYIIYQKHEEAVLYISDTFADYKLTILGDCNIPRFDWPV